MEMGLGFSFEEVAIRVASMLRHWPSVKAQVRAGTANGSVLFIGDSIPVGVGAFTDVYGDQHTNNRAGSIPTHMKNLLNAAGLPSRCDWFLGDGNSGVNLHAAEPRVTLGNGWAPDASFFGLGGRYLSNLTTIDGSLDWATSVPHDAVEICSQAGSAPRMGAVYIDNVLNRMLDLGTGTVALQRTQITGLSMAGHTTGFRRVSGGNRVSWIKPYVAAGGQVIIGNAGRGSVTALELGTIGTTSSIPISLPSTITSAAPDVTIFIEGFNDQTANESPAVYKAAMQVQITAALVTGDAIICAQHPRDETGTTYPSSAYRAVLQELAIENKCPYVDFYALFGSLAQAQARNLYADGGVHMLSAGYLLMAPLLSRILLM